MTTGKVDGIAKQIDDLIYLKMKTEIFSSNQKTAVGQVIQQVSILTIHSR
jgi:hypothetical protein